jgi:hypothetical protein
MIVDILDVMTVERRALTDLVDHKKLVMWSRNASMTRNNANVEWGFPSCPSDVFQLPQKSLCLFLMLESGKKRFAAVMGTILVPQKIYSNPCLKRVVQQRWTCVSSILLGIEPDQEG